MGGERETHPSGCCKRETRSSTAVDDAIEAIPGRVTVHIWSSVRSERDCHTRVNQGDMKIMEETYVSGRDDVVTVIASKPWVVGIRGRGGARTMTHDEVRVES